MTDCTSEVEQGKRFAFGQNWQKFSRLVDDDRIATARESLVTALGTDDLSGRTFLDIGCGSGLFSLAALQLGAKVHSFDYDPDAVATTQQLRERYAPGNDWRIEQGSVLDSSLVSRLGQFDIVYSWGVLHHTGALWEALDTACRLVSPGGLLYVSIYNDQGLRSRAWRGVKRTYNSSGPLTRRLLVAGSGLYLRTAPQAVDLLKSVAGRRPAGGQPRRQRGMSARYDLIDWVGGYPFEVAAPEEVFRVGRRHGMELRHLKTCRGGLGCNEYVFASIADHDDAQTPSAARSVTAAA
ncbi:2-polyprenyl-6-hydroxyphenyl methylase/3-demethylubiquinone-9 3-methyltransferase [Streptomyces sp. SLBN-118]|uniref:class I SAM-dependent methyltransferase n=1 Tax=Streptomyces sp. SLBN-118 TaxID=2768454 RepID=UPI00114F216E|nr:class I SAM-dependent methyltransferase [Streptomyces sp. SLBN-118]TQK50651.1 2-polyprenyl-6-hydroxyphenyl methylase/3-demethylubiquinone-9 3-methyltransferase [Streptomyces sp. SLBN-118]